LWLTLMLVRARVRFPAAGSPGGPLETQPPATSHEVLLGKVRYVFDGDTFELVADGQTWRVRLEGIDAPEGEQSYGPTAREYLDKLCRSGPVRVLRLGQDQYERVLGDVYCGDLWVNGQMVQAGYAWQWSRGSRGAQLDRLQRQAQRAGRGLWTDPHPVPPWDFRRSRSGQRHGQ
jgi:endonuclease YncB( thermonuclease family)